MKLPVRIAKTFGVFVLMIFVSHAIVQWWLGLFADVEMSDVATSWLIIFTLIGQLWLLIYPTYRYWRKTRPTSE